MCVVRIQSGDPAQIIVTVLNDDQRPVVGLTGLVLLSIINSSNQILDFNDLVFKASGAANPNIAMSELVPASQPVDVTGDTDGATGVIAGMADTSDFKVGMFASVSAGFEDNDVAYKILAVTGTSITLEINSDSGQSNVTVTGWFQPGRYKYDFDTSPGGSPYAEDNYSLNVNIPTLDIFFDPVELLVGFFVDNIIDWDAADSELSAAPTGSSSKLDKIRGIFQYFFFRRTITEDTETLYKENDTAVLATTAVSDDDTTVDIERTQ